MSVELSSSQQFLKVKCSSLTGKSVIGVYMTVHLVVAKTSKVKAALDKSRFKPKDNKLSVLLLGLDSISRMNLYRTMPSVVGYLNKQGWLELRGYNKIGDNTFPNLMAILTGLSENQVYNTCYKDTNKHLDWCPFLWKNFSSAGYITSYVEDTPRISTFNCEKNGFIKTPTHYYSRPFMLAAYEIKKSPITRNLPVTCIGSTTISDLILNYCINLVTVFHNSLYFALIWLNDFSHNALNTPASAENNVLKFLKELAGSGALNSSLIVFFSDHGIRVGPIRETYTGWLDERLPFIYIWVPEWYRRLHPDKYANLKMNRNRLTSPFDLRLTLLEILDDTGHNGTMGCPRCQSLFHELPGNRTCEDAGINGHWCTCFQYNDSTEGTSIVHNMAANFVIKSINNELKAAKEIIGTVLISCAELRLAHIHSVRTKMESVRKRYNTYLIVFETLPGRALFEASIEHSGADFRLIGSVSRLNAYGSQGSCIHNSYLIKFCFCVSNIRNES